MVLAGGPPRARRRACDLPTYIMRCIHLSRGSAHDLAGSFDARAEECRLARIAGRQNLSAAQDADRTSADGGGRERGEGWLCAPHTCVISTALPPPPSLPSGIITHLDVGIHPLSTSTGTSTWRIHHGNLPHRLFAPWLVVLAFATTSPHLGPLPAARRAPVPPPPSSPLFPPPLAGVTAEPGAERGRRGERDALGGMAAGEWRASIPTKRGSSAC
ncbi:hypothetical protein GGS23DRAFT_332901 [Durotheca rogersii]|uniref:uncharacterized protein n=1 Tax=Durotheca rogersii TaxID=419775 RepID=UPI00221F8047|nr:uncharacterized protein GGS23DRAFT_332901 [Durotheca rogersii]KAI5858275.1 hypothetical protein GGS23DRAFT_332901 [Durotheca rogersii]